MRVPPPHPSPTSRWPSCRLSYAVVVQPLGFGWPPQSEKCAKGPGLPGAYSEVLSIRPPLSTRMSFAPARESSPAVGSEMPTSLSNRVVHQMLSSVCAQPPQPSRRIRSPALTQLSLRQSWEVQEHKNGQVLTVSIAVARTSDHRLSVITADERRRQGIVNTR